MNSDEQSRNDPGTLEFYSEPVVHIYGARCSEKPPRMDDSMQAYSDPLWTFQVHTLSKDGSDNHLKENHDDGDR